MKEDKIIGKNVVHALVLETVVAAVPVFTACGDNKKEETTAAKQESPVETKAGETIRAREPKMGETAKAGKTRADAPKEGDKVADAKESMMIGTSDEAGDFAFTLVDEKDTVYQFIFEQGKALGGLSDVKAGNRATVTYMGTISETNPFEDMVVSTKKV